MIITKDILNDKVPISMFPTRLDSAMNLYTNIKVGDKTGLLVYNTNPTTWNMLYGFYELNHKFTIDNYEFKNKDITYKELIDEYNKVYNIKYVNELGNTKDNRIKVLIDEFKRTFSIDNVEIGDELEPIYELKYSKSKNVWTLYYFENYIVKSLSDINILLEQDLYEQKILPIDKNIKEIDGVEIASNIPYLLSVESNIEKINRNLIDIE